MDVQDLLDTAKAAQNITTDKGLAEALGVTKQAVSNWRKGVSLPDTVTCATLAGYTGLPLAQVLGIVGEARAISREEKAVWRKLAASAALVALLVAPTLVQSAHAATLHALPQAAAMTDTGAVMQVVLGIMRNSRGTEMGWWTRLLRWFQPGSVKL
ncbi:helix-turn-helix domain-containing protein [Pseudoxanthomonas mexicana]|uniref:helix-turn-helix domain-containing protein n=1 Tax=Pseudoxanthomonas mexicana TaxID=128785 RepID=UPI0024E2560E|nr:helix-turn-helix transcriptional regulator [Pseudoxanthomonas mexicana]